MQSVSQPRPLPFTQINVGTASRSSALFFAKAFRYASRLCDDEFVVWIELGKLNFT